MAVYVQIRDVGCFLSQRQPCPFVVCGFNFLLLLDVVESCNLTFVACFPTHFNTMIRDLYTCIKHLTHHNHIQWFHDLPVMVCKYFIATDNHQGNMKVTRNY